MQKTMEELDKIIVENERKRISRNLGFCPECGASLVTNEYKIKRPLFIFYVEGQLTREQFCPVDKTHYDNKHYLETC